MHRKFLFCFLLLLFFSNIYSSETNLTSEKIDLSATKVFWEFNEKNKKYLLRQLCTDASWRVTKKNNTIVAQKCFFNSKEIRDFNLANIDLPVLYKQKRNEHEYLSISICFGPYEKNNLESIKKTYNSRNKRATLKLNKSIDASNTFGSTLTIVGKNGLVLKICEYSPVKKRYLTVAGLDFICKELQAILNDIINIEKKGYSEKIINKLSINKGQDSSMVIFPAPGRQRGIYVISGYVNPLQQGYTSIHVYHKKSNLEFDTHNSKLKTIEYTGWSNDKNINFYFQTIFTIPVGRINNKKLKEGFIKNSEQLRDAVFKVMFTPINSINLLSKEKKIYLWER